MRSRFLLLLLPAVFVLSCTIEKRLHRPGYHIEWKKRLHAAEEEKAAIRPENAIGAIRSASNETDSIAVAAPNAVQEIPKLSVEAQTIAEKSPKRILPSDSHEQLLKSDRITHNEQTASAKPKTAVVILAAAWFIVAALLVIGGISLISGSPVWGIILLVLGGIMLFLPLLGIGGGRGKKKSSAGFAPFMPFAPKPRFGKMKLHADKDVQQKAVIVFILIVLYVLLAILGVIFGISLISAGTMALGIVLLVLGGLMLLIPAAALIFVAMSGEKR